ncbi:MFS transporter [Amphibiibacter pelophylacis]|uniref:MFS transporter n=1 Tax=Amphibiibacter pelophylacis TaxID=1799477 RepID=A0ACC6P223_9BURK
MSSAPLSREQRRVVLASTLGTMVEWYDFYLYGSLAEILAAQFFSGLGASSAYTLALLAFAAGFVVRPFGAVLFGRIGDMVGRKYTFLITIMLMGLSTAVVGVLPNYASIGVAAPLMLVLMRLMQGLAIGGEYAGAVIYVAEHVPAAQRGRYTAWVQATATLGLLLSLCSIVSLRALLGAEAWQDWGWRLPFLGSLLLLAVSMYVRAKLRESPVFMALRRQGRTTEHPLRDSLGRWSNLRRMLVALFGLTAGQAVIWYTGQFYVAVFLTQHVRLDGTVVNLMLALALLTALPLFFWVGALSDRYGRKPFVMLGFALAALTFIPTFEGLVRAANPALAAAQNRQGVVLYALPSQCSAQFDITGAPATFSSCDEAKRLLASYALSYRTESWPTERDAQIRVGDNLVDVEGTRGLAPQDAQRVRESQGEELRRALESTGYPTQADLGRVHWLALWGLLTWLVVLVALVYAPLGALLAELFPTRVRYTSMSLPYHLGNGWFGGVLTPLAYSVVTLTGNLYSGLIYPVLVAALALLVGLVCLRETPGQDWERGE